MSDISTYPLNLDQARRLDIAHIAQQLGVTVWDGTTDGTAVLLASLNVLCQAPCGGTLIIGPGEYNFGSIAFPQPTGGQWIIIRVQGASINLTGPWTLADNYAIICDSGSVGSQFSPVPSGNFTCSGFSAGQA